MKYRKLGTTDLNVSEVAFGVWSVSTGWWGKVDKDDAIKLLQAAVGAGVTLFDTADTYAEGYGETILHDALGKKRHEIVIGTKFGQRAARDLDSQRCTGPHQVQPVAAAGVPQRPHQPVANATLVEISPRALDRDVFKRCHRAPAQTVGIGQFEDLRDGELEPLAGARRRHHGFPGDGAGIVEQIAKRDLRTLDLDDGLEARLRRGGGGRDKRGAHRQSQRGVQT